MKLVPLFFGMQVHHLCANIRPGSV